MRLACLFALVLTTVCCARAAETFDPLPAGDHGLAVTASPAGTVASYPDAKGFAARRKILLEGVASKDLAGYRRGYFAGGDPGKYLPLHVMARLVLDPKDADALKYINDARALKQHYHFAAVNWARIVPQFRAALTDKTFATFAAGAARAGSYLSTHARGTENHHVMQLTAGVVLPDYLPGPRFGGRGMAEAKRAGKEWLQWYVRNLYHYGQGEWDSSTYVMFDLNGMLNIYDFSKDPECRLLARAALDWYATAYALKYVNGMHTGPKERGGTDRAYQSIGDQTAWLWWGGSKKLTPKDTVNFRFAVPAALSSYRPNRAIRALARREIEALRDGGALEQRNTKPNYWHGLDKAPIPPKQRVGFESLYITKNYTLGSMWYDPDTCTQLTRMQLGVRTDDGAVSITGSAPGWYDNGQSKAPRYASGQGTYISRPDHMKDPKTVEVPVQYAQAGPMLVCMAKFSNKAIERFTYVTTPVEAKRLFAEKDQRESFGDWHWMNVGEVYVLVAPLAGEAEARTLGSGKKAVPALVFPEAGGRSGFAMVVVEKALLHPEPLPHADERPAPPLPPADALRQAFQKSHIVLGTTDWQRKGIVSLDSDLDSSMGGPRGLVAMHRPGEKLCDATIGKRKVDFTTWPVYGGWLVNQDGGGLRVDMGEEGFAIDFSGKLPVWGTFQPMRK